MSYRDRLAQERAAIDVTPETRTIHWSHSDPGFPRQADRCRPITERGRLVLASIVITDYTWDWMETYRATFAVPPRHGLPSGLTGSEASVALLRQLIEEPAPELILVARATPEDWRVFEAWLDKQKDAARAENVT